MSRRITRTNTTVKVNQNTKDDNTSQIFNKYNVKISIDKNEIVAYQYTDILKDNGNVDLNLLKNISSKKNGIYLIYNNDIANNEFNLAISLIKKYTIPAFVVIPLDFNINKLNQFKNEYENIIKSVINAGLPPILYVDANRYTTFNSLYNYLNNNIVKYFSKFFSGIFIDNYKQNYLNNNEIQTLKNDLKYRFLTVNIKNISNINIIDNLNQIDMVVVKDETDLSFNITPLQNKPYSKYEYVFIANNILNYNNIDKQSLKSILQNFGYVYLTIDKTTIPHYLDNLLSDIEKYNIDLQLKINFPQPDKITIVFNNNGDYAVADNVINANSVNGYRVNNNLNSNSLWTSDKIITTINQATNGLYPPDNYTIVVSNNQLKVADNVINARSVNGYTVNDNDASQLWTGNKILSEINRVINGLKLPIPDNITIKTVNNKLTVQNGVVDGGSVNGVSVNNNIIGNSLWTSDKIMQFIDEKINEKFNIYYSSFDGNDPYIVFEFDYITFYLTNNITNYISFNNNFKKDEVFYVYDVISNRLYFVDKYEEYMREINYIPLVISSREYRDGYIRIVNNAIEYRYDGTNYIRVIPLVGARYFNVINETTLTNFQPLFFMNAGSSLSIKNVDYIPVIFNKNIDNYFKVILTDKITSPSQPTTIRLLNLHPRSSMAIEFRDNGTYNLIDFDRQVIASKASDTDVIYGSGEIYINTNMYFQFTYINQSGNMVLMSGFSTLNSDYNYVKFDNKVSNLYLNRFV